MVFSVGLSWSGMGDFRWVFRVGAFVCQAWGFGVLTTSEGRQLGDRSRLYLAS